MGPSATPLASIRKRLPKNTLTALGVGEWRVPQLGLLLQNKADGVTSIDAYEMDLKRSGQADRRLVINVQKIAYGEPDKLRLLVAISDVTNARWRPRRIRIN